MRLAARMTTWSSLSSSRSQTRVRSIVVLGRPTIQMSFQHLSAVEERVGSFHRIVGVYIRPSLPQHGEVEILVGSSKVRVSKSSWGRVLSDYLTVGRINLLVAIQILVFDVAKFSDPVRWDSSSNHLPVLEVSVCHVAVERTDGMAFQT